MKRIVVAACSLAVLAACHSESDGSCEEGTCVGCCTADGACLTGTERIACGWKGEACERCGADFLCADGGCVDRNICGRYTCPEGCCDAENRCQPGNLDTSCAMQGSPCMDCGTDHRCVDRACVPR